MAQGESISTLYLRLGLDYSSLDSDIIRASETLKSNISRISRENTIIKLRAQIDLAGVTDEAKRLKIQQDALNQQIANQKLKLQGVTASWKDATQRMGEHSKQAQSATIAVERERLALVELEQELKKIAEQQKALPKGDNSLVSGYKSIKNTINNAFNSSIGELANKYNELTTASQSADTAITKSLEIIGSIPNPVGKAIAALASVPLIFRGIENSIVETVKAATSSGDAVYVMSRGMQMSVAEMGKLSTVAKVTGIDINEVNSNLRRLAVQFVKSGENDNLMTKTFDKYNVKLTDANGNLKKGLDLSLAVADGLKKAQLAGKGLEFISAVGGRFWSGDFITYLEDLRDNVNASNKIVKNGLANPVLAHALQGNINAMNTQSAQLKASFESVFMPVANEIVPRITERMGELTKFLSVNKTEIKAFGESVAKFFGSIEDGADLAISAIKKVVEAIKTMKISDTQKAVIELNKSMANRIDPQIYQQNLSYYNNIANPTYFAPMLKNLDETHKQVKEKTEAIIKEIHNVSIALELERGKSDDKNLGFSELSSIVAERNDEHFSEKLKAVEETVKKTREYTDELYKLTHSEYESKVYDLRKWQQDLLNDESTTAEQRIAIEKLFAEKSKRLESDRQKEITAIRDQEESRYRSALENELLSAEKAKEEWLKIGMECAEAEELYQRRIAKAHEETSKKIQDYVKETTDIEYSLTHDAFDKQLRDIEKWKDAQLEKADTAEEVSAIIANAAMKESEAFEREMDRIQGRIESAQDELMRLTASQKDYDIYQAEKHYQEQIKDGISEELARAIYEARMAKIAERIRENKNGSYEKSQSSAPQYIYEFGENKNKSLQSLATMDSKYLAYQSMMDKINNGSIRLNEATLQNIKSIEAEKAARQKIVSVIEEQSGIEVIEGDQVRNSPYFMPFQDQQPQKINDYSPNIEEVLRELPQMTRDVIEDMAKGSIQKYENGVYGGSSAANLSNFTNQLEMLGVSTNEVFSYLDEMNQQLQRASEMMRDTADQEKRSEKNMTVAPNINIDLGGAYVFDNEMKQRLTEDITNQIAEAVKQSVNQATNSPSYGYAN